MNAQELIATLPIGTTFRIAENDVWQYRVEDGHVVEVSLNTPNLTHQYDHSREVFAYYDESRIVDIVRPEPASEGPLVIVEVPTREVELERERDILAARVRELESRTYSQYDEVMRPMFRNTARIATNAGFCSEYDRIAEAIGGPSRNELFGREYTFTVNVEVTRTVSVEVSAIAADEDGAWENIDYDDIRYALDNEDVEYDNFDFGGYSEVSEGDLSDLD